LISANIIRTFFSRSGSVVINFFVVVISARLLGDEGIGNISLLILAITINALFVGLWGGAGLVYLTPRHSTKNLLLIAYSWSVIATIIVVWVLSYFELVPAVFGSHVFVLAILSAFGAVNMYVILGRERVRTHNILTFFQSVSLLVSLLVLFFIVDFIDVRAYMWSLYVSFGFVWVGSSIVLLRISPVKVQKSFSETVKQTFSYSVLTQSASAMQLMNYRFSYYVIDYFFGTATLGQFSVAVQLAEGIWILGKSLGLVLYSKLSNVYHQKEAVKLTVLFIKISVFATIAATAVILLLPQLFFTFLFGPDFTGIQELLMYLAPGIIFVSATMVFSSFFSGTGLIKINTIGSLIGLISTIVLVVWMVYLYGLKGAAIATSLSYMSSFIYANYQFKKISGLGMEIYWISSSNWQQIRKLFSGLFGKDQ
jgi:O-antigen/teichoic acid export membrane protein